MSRFWVLIVLPLLIGRASAADVDATAPEQKIADFTLSDAGGKSYALADFKRSSIVVVVFVGTQCPLAQLYLPRMNRLAAKYRDRGVAFLAINSNAQDSIEDLTAYARTHPMDFPLLKDPGNLVADQFDAQRTPEVFVLDRRRVVRYRGRIDDQYGVGYTRSEPKQHDLRQAIDQLLAGEAVSPRRTEAVGCRIGRVHKPSENGQVTYAK
jgi:peroxiredoxin